MHLPRARPIKKITLDTVLDYANYSTVNWSTFVHFVNTASNNIIAAPAFWEYLKHNFGLYILNAQTVNRLFEDLTPENYDESFVAMFGTGAGFTLELSQYRAFLTDTQTISETITREGEHDKEKNSTNSGGIATAKDQTTTRTPTGNVTTVTRPNGTVQTVVQNTLSETVNVSLGSWDSENLQGSEQTVTSGTPSSTETVTDGKTITETVTDAKVITERVTGNASSTTDTRANETTENGTHSETETKERTETGKNNDIIKNSLLTYFAKMFVNTFCITCYDISSIEEW